MRDTFLDRVIAWASPTAGNRRLAERQSMAARRAAADVVMHYRASDLARRSESLRAVGGDADAVAQLARRGLSLASRDVIRNNPTASRALSVIQNNVIGAGIEPRLVTTDKGLQREWRDDVLPHLSSVAVDGEGVLPLGGLQASAFGAAVADGEALIVWPEHGARHGQVRVLEADYLDTRMQGPVGASGNTLYDGIERDAWGRIVAYHLFGEHPGSPVLGSNWRGLESERVDAARVAHLYRVDRPGQRRGVSWFAPVLDDLVALAENDEAQLMRQRIAACFSVFWRTDDMQGNPPPSELAPGLIQAIGQNDEVSFANPPEVTGYDDFTKVHLRRVAVGMGITYESLTGDLTGVNFASGRLGRIDMGQNVERWQWHMALPGMCRPTGNWILKDWAFNAGGFAAIRALSKARIDWTPPPPVMADPKTETQVAVQRIEAGLASRRGEIRASGYDPDEIDREIDADMQRRRDLAALKQPGAAVQLGNSESERTLDA
ncbi:phage portal protein [Rhodobacter sp. NTK016B]|uniref:phage portal protein n=1 Tax=Rhodobacter sp. NTK016B TaxID=2759676 RepID=UPI001A8D54FE|nr:phage portal protein [Rhodobacter sp. NTK016B]MBN8291035.1 phage portal protein [Rhodobacter sp. NTK016B]